MPVMMIIIQAGGQGRVAGSTVFRVARSSLSPVIHHPSRLHVGARTQAPGMFPEIPCRHGGELEAGTAYADNMNVPRPGQ